MTKRSENWLLDLGGEFNKLKEARAEWRKTSDPQQKRVLQRFIDKYLDERSSPYYLLRNMIIRETRNTSEYDEVYADIAKLDRKFRGRRVRIYTQIVIGAWALTFVEQADRAGGILKFLNGQSFAIAPDADGVWKVVAKLLEAPSESLGYVYLGKNWQGPFSRDGKGDSDRLLKFIHAEGRGRGGTGRYRLMDEPYDSRSHYED